MKFLKDLQLFVVLILIVVVSTQGIPSHSDEEFRASFLGKIWNKTLDFANNQLGVVECKGVDEYVGFGIFKLIVGHDVSFGNEFLCHSTCTGRCVPNQSLYSSPSSTYAFGCQCSADKCTSLRGPTVVTDHFPASMYIPVCTRNPNCTCEGMTDDSQAGYRGYLCHWAKNNSTETTTGIANQSSSSVEGISPKKIFEMLPNTFVGEWCACCPKTMLGNFFDSVNPFI